MRTWKWYSKLLLGLLLLAFAYWVWPTPWRYFASGRHSVRENRVTHRVQRFDLHAGRWETP